MPIHTIAYGASVLTAGTLGAIAPIPDATVTESGDLIYVPAKYNRVAAVGALVTANAFTQAQLRAPSLREMYFIDVIPLHIAPTFGGARALDTRFDSPLKLDTNEGLEFFADGGGDGTTAADCYGVVWLTDGAIAPAKGAHYKLRATSAIAQAALGWVNGALTFDQTLPVGKYQIIGMRAMSSDMVAARLVFIGAGAITRPGVPGLADETTGAPLGFATGEMGVIGEFDSVTPPSVDVLGGVSTAQSYEFDLIKTA